MIFRNLLAVSCGLSLLSWLFCRGWRRIPLFGAYLAVQLPLLIGCRPESALWLQTEWVNLEPTVVALRFAATAEAFWVHSADPAIQPHRKRIAVALSGLLAALLALVWVFTPGSPLQNVVQARRLAQIGCAAFLLLYAVLVWSVGHLGIGWRSGHLLLFVAMLAILAGISVASMSIRPWSREAWHFVDDAANMATAVLLACWAIMFWEDKPMTKGIYIAAGMCLISFACFAFGLIVGLPWHVQVFNGISICFNGLRVIAKRST